MYEYDEDFYRYINRGALLSARNVLPILLDTIPGSIDSVLDVGCGAGAWLSVWKSYGVKVVGLDGPYVNKDALLVAKTEFIDADLVQGFDLNRRFGLVQSLEVAEHLPESAATGFVESLCRHSDMILFSAAPPGQGGENHINEQSYEYWRGLFREQGYAMYDPVRAALKDNGEVKPWYRYNTFLYVKQHGDAAVPDSLLAHRVGEQMLAQDISPPLYQVRKKLIRLLPTGFSTVLAIFKKTLFRFLFQIKDKLA